MIVFEHYSSNLNSPRHAICVSSSRRGFSSKTQTVVLGTSLDLMTYRFPLKDQTYARQPLVFFGPVVDVFHLMLMPHIRSVSTDEILYGLEQPSSECVAKTIADSNNEAETFDVLTVPSNLQYTEDGDYKIITGTLSSW